MADATRMTGGKRARLLPLLAALALLPATPSLQGEQPGAAATRPNILLIISDDIGIDATTGMYPGLAEGLVRQYGPSGRGHPDYRLIDGRPASTPHLGRFARQGITF